MSPTTIPGNLILQSPTANDPLMDLNTQPSLDLQFATSKTLDDRVSGQNLITFSRSTTGTYVDSNGIIQTAAIDAPRFDHDPATGESLGLLIEEARTNDVYESENIANGSPWVVSNVSPTAGFNAPDGSTNAVRILENTANLAHFTFWNVSSALTTATVSAFVKPIGREYLGIRAYRAGNVWENIVFNVTGEGSVVNYQSGTSSSYSNVQGFIEKHADGWYRISITCTNTAGLSLPLVLHTHTTATPTLNTTGEEAFLGDVSKGFYAWGAQIENGSFPTSYIPNTTGSSSVTRAADVAEITGSNFSRWYEQSEGTIVVDFITGYEKGTNTAIGSLNNGTASQRISLRPRNTIYENLAVASLTVSETPPGILDKIAWSFDSSGFSLISGGDSDLYTSPLASQVLTQLEIGKLETGPDGEINGHIKRLTYYPYRLPDATLQEITS